FQSKDLSVALAEQTETMEQIEPLASAPDAPEAGTTVQTAVEALRAEWEPMQHVAGDAQFHDERVIVLNSNLPAALEPVAEEDVKFAWAEAKVPAVDSSGSSVIELASFEQPAEAAA